MSDSVCNKTTRCLNRLDASRCIKNHRNKSTKERYYNTIMANYLFRKTQEYVKGFSTVDSRFCDCHDVSSDGTIHSSLMQAKFRAGTGGENSKKNSTFGRNVMASQNLESPAVLKPLIYSW